MVGGINEARGPRVDTLKLSDGNTEVSYTNPFYLHIYVKLPTVRLLKRKVIVIRNCS